MSQWEKSLTSSPKEKMKSRVRITLCPGCGKQYTNHFNMKRHYALTHLQEHKFVCELCGKSLSSKQNYQEHVYTHTGERPFVCKQCGVCYRQCSQLSVHKRIHKAFQAAQRETFQELKLTDILDGEKLKQLGSKAVLMPKLFEAVALPPLDNPRPQAQLSIFVFAD